MKKLLTLLLVLPSLLFAQKKFTESLITEFNQNLKARPEATIKAYTHPNFSFINGKGQRVGYKELLANYTYNIEPVREMTNVKIVQVGNTATATGNVYHEWYSKAKPEQMSKYSGMFTYVYVYEAGMWKILAAQHSDVNNTERNKALYRALNKEANEHNYAAYGSFYDESFEIKGFGKGPQAAIANAKSYEKTFPDLKITIHELIADGDLIMAKCEATGTQLGEMNGIPATGKKGNVAHWTINRFNADGKITESWNLNDNLGMMQQLGILK